MSSLNPLISVIIPTFNRASFLGEAIRSVLGQDYFDSSGTQDDFEILVIDDGSTDDTAGVTKSFVPMVKYQYQARRGVSSARNKGLRLAEGKYIAFLDSDDLWMKDKMRRQMNFMKAFPKAMVCFTEEIWLRNGVRVNPKKKHRKHSGWIFEKILPLCLLSLSSALFRKEIFEAIGGFDETLPVCEDYEFSLRLASKYPVYLISTPLIIKRGGHPDQLSRTYWGMDRFRVEALEKTLTLDLSSEQERLVRQELAWKCRILVRGFEKRGKAEEAASYRRFMAKYK